MGKNNRFQSNKRPFNHQGRHRNNNDNKDSRIQRSIDNLKEVHVGITEYLGTSTGFHGIIKAKYSDFHVNEIDTEENVTSLTNIIVPEAKVELEEKLLVAGDEPKIVEDGTVSRELWQSLKKLVDEKNKTDSVEINVTKLEKENRTEVHKTIKLVFGQTIVSSTKDRDGEKFIVCSLYNKSAQTDVRTKWTWPHEYTYFVLHKVNMDTMKAASELALNLNVKPNLLAYAGTKDKRAVTSQWFCIKKREPSRLAKAAQRIQNLWIGNFTFKPETLKLGNLNGNRFRIAIRQIPDNQALVEEAVKSLKESGFINYYGLQRFGNCASIPTFLVGKALLKGNWKEACELILKPREGDPAYLEKMRKYWWATRDAKGARDMLLKTNNSIESKLLVGLSKHNENDVVSALENIPRNTRLLYIHAYQSLIWNKVASKRAKQGLQIKVGDLVYSDKKVVIPDAIDEIDEASDTEMEVPTADEEVPKIDYKSLVRPLTQQDLDAGQYSIADIVLPLPGHDISYPGNETADWYSELLAEDDLSSQKLKQKNRTYSLTGAYRKMIEKPGDMTWRFVKYNSDNDMLLNTEFELLKKRNLIKLPEDGKLNAVLLEFSLKSSTYATMALREIMKIDTSTENQIKLLKESVKASDPEVPATKEELPEEKKLKLE